MRATYDRIMRVWTANCRGRIGFGVTPSSAITAAVLRWVRP